MEASNAIMVILMDIANRSGNVLGHAIVKGTHSYVCNSLANLHEEFLKQ